MNRLQKKCFAASAGVHLLLVIILFVGPGFFISHQTRPDDLAILNFVPIKTVDELVAPGGGNPKAKPPAAVPLPTPPPPQPPVETPPPQPPPEKVREPEPAKEIKPLKNLEDSLEPSKERQPRRIEISTNLVSRQKQSMTDKRTQAEAQEREQAKALADARKRLARQIGRAAEHIGSELSGGTAVELQGPGGGGLPYANFMQAVKSAYDNAWVLPDGVANDEAVTTASVTIARNGDVISHRITRFSGDAVVDHSVQTTLERVRYVAPLPDNSTEDQRTVWINFSVRAKRLLG